MEVVTEDGSDSSFNTFLFILTTLESTVWLLYYLASAIFILAEGVSLNQFMKFSLPLQEVDKPSNLVEFFVKIICYGILLLSTLGEFVSFCCYGHLHHDWFYFILNILNLVALTTSIWARFDRKLSTEHANTELLVRWELRIGILLTIIGESMTLLRCIPESFYLSTASPDRTFWIYFFIRIIIIIILSLEPWVQEEPKSEEDEKKEVKKEDEETKNEDEKDEKKKEKKESFLSCISYLYRMRGYFLPTSTFPKICFGLLVALVGVDSAADFLSNYYSMKMLNSLQFDSPGNNQTSSESSTMKLEFRWDFVLIYFSIMTVQGNFIYSMKYYFRKQVEKSSSSKLQMDLFTKLHDMSIRWHLENQATEVFATMSSAPYILENILQNFLWMVPSILSSIIALTYLINSYSFKLSSLVITTALIATAIDFAVARGRERKVEEAEDAATEVRTVRAASFDNFETVKYFTNEEYEGTRFAKARETEEDVELKGMCIYFIYSIGGDVFQYVSEMLVVLVVMKLIAGGEELSIGDYTYFLGVYKRIQSPFDLFLSFYRELQSNAVSAKKVLKILDATPEIVDEQNATELKIDASGGTIEFRNVDFSYVPERQILKKLNLVIPAGQTVAFVGHSGSGKSTVTKLIFRFYDPTGGEILVNGQNIRNITCKSLRKAIGVVPQDIILFDDTIKENIKYGKVETATDEEIIEAAKAACLHERIDSFPQKYETEVGSRGLKLSGGEKQRLALARTVLKNPPILILDEATSSLDTETEKQIQTSTETLCKNRTTVIIAHRLSTIVNADKIFVLQEGVVVEAGTHAELLEMKGVYMGMWNQQFNTTTPPPPIKSKLFDTPQHKVDTEIRRRRQLFATRLQQTVWKVSARRSISTFN